ncbi:hypothetical protein PHYSODRAFT_298213 [Phytophthora sojae]|uniref:Uncharacterized protein n=1 Tax=Phytophthora sojae (strain P6497) TaxID=1094619 RepID=G4Z9W1_PHYSP|nr:hypothetical protein PHYSODRAFT_298213 [Phytophthora sojae]EGZ19814.1 hypothetical protein PHYSODRAFT_298213 [Phytophthora sojae]|eukprot:XP_009522531.1 hypothetical protein PHYSODRAFT_298213 [Phytophthora sojae]
MSGADPLRPLTEITGLGEDEDRALIIEVPRPDHDSGTIVGSNLLEVVWTPSEARPQIAAFDAETRTLQIPVDCVFSLDGYVKTLPVAGLSQWDRNWADVFDNETGDVLALYSTTRGKQSTMQANLGVPGPTVMKYLSVAGHQQLNKQANKETYLG